MAFTSFTVRNTTADGGSALRRTNVTQDSGTPNGTDAAVYDSGLRADGYFIPVPRSYLESTFSVNVYRRDEVELEWNIATPLVATPAGMDFEPVELLIRASASGEPVTANDGFLVKAYTYSNYEETLTDKQRPYIIEGGWIYYSLFLKYADSTGDAFYEKVADLSVQIPINFNSTNALWSRIPTYYRELDYDYATNTSGYDHENGPLYRFIELFGWEMDRVRTTIYDTMRINDPDVVHSSAIDALATQTGVEFGKYALGTTKLRTILNNIGYLRRSKGTQNSVEAYISALTGCGVTESKEANWTPTTLGTPTWGVTTVVYDNGLWVGVGGSGKVYTSTDLASWTNRAFPSTRNLLTVAYGNGRWTIGSSANTGQYCIYTSTNGVNWSNAYAATATTYINKVLYENNLWVAVGSVAGYPVVLTSTDGVTWATKYTGSSLFPLNDVAYGNGKWIAVSHETQGYLTSTDGVTWTLLHSSPTGVPNYKIAYHNNVWVTSTHDDVKYSTDDGATWTVSLPFAGYYFIDIRVDNQNFVVASEGGDIYTSTTGMSWKKIGFLNDTIGSIAVHNGTYVASTGTSESAYIGKTYSAFNVHPMRANLFTDPFFNQGTTSPLPADSGTKQRKWTELAADSRTYGWGVYTTFSSSPSTDMTVSTAGDKLTVTLPPLSGTATVHVYSRGKFSYNNDLTYYYSAISSHPFTPRFMESSFVDGSMENTSPPASLQYADSWNNSVTSFPTFQDTLTNGSRRIVASIPSSTTPSAYEVFPVFKFDITLSATAPTVLTFQNPLVEYRNSSGEFFTGSTAMGGFIPNAAIDGDPSAGLYDYHWGSNASGTVDRDFSFYTLDFQRSKSVTIDVVSNYIMPVTLVKGVDYEINWEVLE